VKALTVYALHVSGFNHQMELMAVVLWYIPRYLSLESCGGLDSLRFACLWIKPADGVDIGGPLVHAEVSVGAGAPGLGP